MAAKILGLHRGEVAPGPFPVHEEAERHRRRPPLAAATSICPAKLLVLKSSEPPTSPPFANATRVARHRQHDLLGHGLDALELGQRLPLGEELPAQGLFVPRDEVAGGAGQRDHVVEQRAGGSWRVLEGLQYPRPAQVHAGRARRRYRTRRGAWCPGCGCPAGQPGRSARAPDRRRPSPSRRSSRCCRCARSSPPARGAPPSCRRARGTRGCRYRATPSSMAMGSSSDNRPDSASRRYCPSTKVL